MIQNRSKSPRLTVRSVVSELQMVGLRSVLAWYSMLVRLVHTFKECINVLYQYLHKKHVPIGYTVNVPYFLAKIEAYHIVLLCLVGILSGVTIW